MPPVLLVPAPKRLIPSGCSQAAAPKRLLHATCSDLGCRCHFARIIRSRRGHSELRDARGRLRDNNNNRMLGVAAAALTAC